MILKNPVVRATVHIELEMFNGDVLTCDVPNLVPLNPGDIEITHIHDGPFALFGDQAKRVETNQRRRRLKIELSGRPLPADPDNPDSPTFTVTETRGKKADR